MFLSWAELQRHKKEDSPQVFKLLMDTHELDPNSPLNETEFQSLKLAKDVIKGGATLTLMHDKIFLFAKYIIKQTWLSEDKKKYFGNMLLCFLQAKNKRKLHQQRS